MLSVRDSLPVANYSTKIISDQAGTTFDPVNNSRIRINVPASNSMIDLRNSYIQYEVQLKAPAGAGTPAAAGNNTFTMKFGNNQPSSQIFRNYRAYLDNREIENIAHINILEKFKQEYEEDVSQKGLEATFDNGNFKANNQSFLVSDGDCTQGFLTVNRTPTKQVYRPKCSGLWNYPNGLPLVALGNLTLEWELEESRNVLTPQGRLANITVTQPPKNAAVTDFVLTRTDTVSEPHYKGYGWGFSDAQVKRACPVTVGNVVRIQGTLANDDAIDQYRVVTGVAQAVNGELTVTVAGVNLNADNPNDDFTMEVIFGANAVVANAPVQDTNKYTYEVSKVEFVARVIELPPQYTQAMQTRIAREGFSMDIQTYTNYVNNILENVGTQSVLIPNYNQRVKSVMSIPIENGQTDYFYDREGKIGNLRNYQAVVGTRREPQRPVSVENQTGNANEYASQEHLHELTKSLSASGSDVRSLRKFRENFAMSRSLSYDGSSESLQNKGFRFEFNHLSNVVSAKVLYSYVYSIRRIMVSMAEGLVVLQ